ncbi:hypothetical protein D3C73_1414730 [compost metagenome]
MVNAAVEEVQTDACLRQQSSAHQLTRDLQQLIVHRHHMIAVPPHRTAYMQQQMAAEQQNRRQLVADHFRRMEVARIQRDRLAARYSIPHVELMGTDYVAL